jgi:sugar lactone lactonase YvrE
MKKVFKIFTLVILLVSIILIVFLRLRYGGGREYEDISTSPLYGRSQLEVFYAHHEPIGNVAVSKDTSLPSRVFFTIHPESRPEKIKLLEIRKGIAVPYPDEDQQTIFNTILGVFTDRQNRLWTLDHGNHGMDDVKVIAFDLLTDKIVHEFVFPASVAKRLSFFNDLSVSPDGKFMVISNVSFFGKRPSLVVYNIESGECKDLLENHYSVKDEGYVPVTPAKKMRFLGGLIDLLIGIDGIDFSRDGKYVYYAGVGHSELFRIPTDVLTDLSRPEEEVAGAVERVGKKPLSDGIRTDHAGNVYITDVEHQGVYVIPPTGNGFTLIKDDRIRWADGLSLSGDGTFYLADSDIPGIMLKSKSHIKANAPYYIFRFKALD